jgi:hypothetical protein
MRGDENEHTMRGVENEHSLLHFSPRQLTAFKPRFVFLDRPYTHKCRQGQKSFLIANPRLRFSACYLSSPCTRQQCFSNIMISVTVNSFRAPFRISGPIQHAKHLQKPKTFSHVNPNLRFQRGPLTPFSPVTVAQ